MKRLHYHFVAESNGAQPQSNCLCAKRQSVECLISLFSAIFVTETRKLYSTRLLFVRDSLIIENTCFPVLNPFSFCWIMFNEYFRRNAVLPVRLNISQSKSHPIVSAITDNLIHLPAFNRTVDLFHFFVVSFSNLVNKSFRRRRHLSAILNVCRKTQNRFQRDLSKTIIVFIQFGINLQHGIRRK